MAPGGIQRYRCQACRRIFQTIRRGKDPALKKKACQLFLEKMGMRDIGRDRGIHAKDKLNVGSGQRWTPSLARSSALSVEEGRSKMVEFSGSRSSTY